MGGSACFEERLAHWIPQRGGTLNEQGSAATIYTYRGGSHPDPHPQRMPRRSPPHQGLLAAWLSIEPAQWRSALSFLEKAAISAKMSAEDFASCPAGSASECARWTLPRCGQFSIIPRGEAIRSPVQNWFEYFAFLPVL